MHSFCSMQLIYCLFSREENADKLLMRDIKINNKIWCQLIVFQWNNISGQSFRNIQSYHLSGKWQSSSNFGMNCVIFFRSFIQIKKCYFKLFVVFGQDECQYHGWPLGLSVLKWGIQHNSEFIVICRFDIGACVRSYRILRPSGARTHSV